MSLDNFMYIQSKHTPTATATLDWLSAGFLSPALKNGSPALKNGYMSQSTKITFKPGQSTKITFKDLIWLAGADASTDVSQIVSCDLHKTSAEKCSELTHSWLYWESWRKLRNTKFSSLERYGFFLAFDSTIFGFLLKWVAHMWCIYAEKKRTDQIWDLPEDK